ncbi:MAG: 50S ribosomal protein L10 [Deltaproteobacteria bacterium SG8_13]|nr:MAG: 50S ribosomal protein L10 [Deltaproteobacteria bacterium SG8_13]
MKLEEKKQIVEDLHERLTKSKVVIVTDYKGLDVAAVTELRRQLRESQIEFQVVKNTLLVRAAADTDAALMQNQFKGPSAIALSYDDPVSPAKILTTFAKDNEKLEIRAGVMSGKVLDLAAIKALSNLPSREQLLAQLLSAMNGVPTSLVRVLAAVPQKLVYALQAIKEQKEAA